MLYPKNQHTIFKLDEVRKQLKWHVYPYIQSINPYSTPHVKCKPQNKEYVGEFL